MSHFSLVRRTREDSDLFSGMLPSASTRTTLEIAYFSQISRQNVRRITDIFRKVFFFFFT